MSREARALIAEYAVRPNVLSRQREQAQAIRRVDRRQLSLNSLDELTDDLGLQMAGEFRAGNGQEPGDGFSGVRIAYPPVTYGSQDWNIAGVENDVLQFGVRASDGTAFAGAGAVVLDADGITIDAPSSVLAINKIKWVNNGDLTVAEIYAFTNGTTPNRAGNVFIGAMSESATGGWSTVELLTRLDTSNAGPRLQMNTGSRPNFRFTNFEDFRILQKAIASASGNPALLVGTDNHTALTASAESTHVNFSLANTIQWATGALTTQREFRVQRPTYAFVGASTLTTAVLVSIEGAPSAGTNATITNPIALQVGGATSQVSASGLKYRAIDIPAHTVTITGTTQVTAAPGAAGLSIGAVTLTDSSAVTVDAAASLYVSGPPVAAGSVTLTAPYAIWVDAGNVRLDGQVVIGGAPASGAITNYVEINSTSDTSPGGRDIRFNLYTASASGATVVLQKSRHTTIGSHTVVQSGDSLGLYGFGGSDGDEFLTAAFIQGVVDGTPGNGDMPGQLRFSTTADAASSPTERFRIDSRGNLSGGAQAADATMAGGVALKNGTAPGGAVTDTFSLWAGDAAAGKSWPKFMPEDGTARFVLGVSATQGVSSGTGTVKMNGATSRNSVGWITTHDHQGTTIYIPYWTTVTG